MAAVGTFAPSGWPPDRYQLNFLNDGVAANQALWDGRLHRFAWYPRALSTEEIGANYRAGLRNSAPVVWDSQVRCCLNVCVSWCGGLRWPVLKCTVVELTKYMLIIITAFIAHAPTICVRHAVSPGLGAAER